MPFDPALKKVTQIWEVVTDRSGKKTYRRRRYNLVEYPDGPTGLTQVIQPVSAVQLKAPRGTEVNSVTIQYVTGRPFGVHFAGYVQG